MALAGIDLSAAFDVVDVELLIKRLKIMGPITLNIYDKTISSNKSINILGVIFDSKLQ